MSKFWIRYPLFDTWSRCYIPSLCCSFVFPCWFCIRPCSEVWGLDCILSLFYVSWYFHYFHLACFQIFPSFPNFSNCWGLLFFFLPAFWEFCLREMNLLLLTVYVFLAILWPSSLLNFFRKMSSSKNTTWIYVFVTVIGKNLYHFLSKAFFNPEHFTY